MIGVYMSTQETEAELRARANALTSGLAESIARSRGETVTHYPSSSSASSEGKRDEGYIFRRPRQSSPNISLGARDIIRGPRRRQRSHGPQRPPQGLQELQGLEELEGLQGPPQGLQGLQELQGLEELERLQGLEGPPSEFTTGNGTGTATSSNASPNNENANSTIAQNGDNLNNVEPGDIPLTTDKEAETKRVKIYNKVFLVETTVEDPLTEEQERLALHLRLPEFEGKDDEWRRTVLKEVIDGCTEDASITIAPQCHTFRSYLEELAQKVFDEDQPILWSEEEEKEEEEESTANNKDKDKEIDISITISLSELRNLLGL